MQGGCTIIIMAVTGPAGPDEGLGGDGCRHAVRTVNVIMSVQVKQASVITFNIQL